MNNNRHALHLKKLLLTVTAIGLLVASPVIMPATQAAAESSSMALKPVKLSAGMESYSLLDNEGHIWIMGKRVPTK
ncbi:hypothetical protein [Paenibacillus sp. N3.4]|uniref:hypothetical protein n=1 Tax=Paenibacillus sp. N3.4 TaxID=2603222 RepID=UPI0011C7B71F|nr:hypothetical protein [Paenibacillus sp. N3.4]TXK85907.1 hypothetical protein FU659_00070 [Paenibacillus sp. N3.4]